MAVAAYASMAGAELPVGVDDEASHETLARASTALAGHPAEPKVALLAAPSTAPGEPASGAYVLPLQSDLQAPLTLITAPPCAELAATVEVLNEAVGALTELAREVVEQAGLVARLWADYQQYIHDHEAELDVARTGTILLLAAEMEVQQWRNELKRTEDPELAALYEAFLDEALARVEALQSDEVYVAAWQVKAGADALMDAIVLGTDAWHDSYEARLATLTLAVDEGRRLYDELSALEVAVGEAEFPIWGDVVEALLTENDGVRGGIRFSAARLENVRWSLDDATIPRTAPIFFDFFTGGDGATAHRREPLGGLGELEPAPALVAPSSPETDFAPLSTEFGEYTDGRPAERQTGALVSTRPSVRVALPLGAYCGVLKTVEQAIDSSGDSTASATLVAHHYTLAQTPPSPTLTHWARADFEVLVGGAPFEVACSVDMATFSAAVASGEPDIQRLWYHPGEWDESLFHRLGRLGIRCAYPSLEGAAIRAMVASLRQAFEYTINDVGVMVGQLFGDDWPTESVQGPLALPDPQGPLFASFRWSPLYWKPGHLVSQVTFGLQQ